MSASAAPAYGAEKSQLFLATNLTLLIAGIVVAARREHLLLLLVLTLAVATAGALLLTWGFVTRTLVPTIGDGRYSLAAEQYPIELARQTGHAILIGLFLVLAGSTRRLRLAALAALPVLSVAMIAAGSRGPILGLLAGAVVLLALASGVRTTRGRLFGAACAAVVAGVVVAQVVPESTIQRSLSTVLASSSGLDSNGRSEIWSKTADVVREHPVTGIGTGGYAAVDPELVYPHNLPLEVAAELGVVGLLLLLALLVHAVVVLRGVWRHAGDALRGEVALIAGLYASAFVNALLSHDIPGNAAVWLAIGLGMGLSLRLRHAQTSARAGGSELTRGPRPPRAARA